MMSAGLIQSVQLAIQHMGKPSQWVPVGGMELGKRPGNALQRETMSDRQIVINVVFIIVAHQKAMVKSLTENESHGQQKHGTNARSRRAAAGKRWLDCHRTNTGIVALSVRIGETGTLASAQRILTSIAAVGRALLSFSIHPTALAPRPALPISSPRDASANASGSRRGLGTLFSACPRPATNPGVDLIYFFVLLAHILRNQFELLGRIDRTLEDLLAAGVLGDKNLVSIVNRDHQL